ncbi:NPHP4 [Bugula neritina]|uniref:NPHP4 n=1 Tax=Bugula neritina TaxID=10212 RepID=A0A7J7JN97_BUGNE|nr:NPHP4 [Bugula neritina]
MCYIIRCYIGQVSLNKSQTFPVSIRWAGWSPFIKSPRSGEQVTLSFGGGPTTSPDNVLTYKLPKFEMESQSAIKEMTGTMTFTFLDAKKEMNGHEMAVSSNLAVPYQQPAASYVSDTSMYTESMLHSAAGAIVGKPPRSAPTTPRSSLHRQSLISQSSLNPENRAVPEPPQQYVEPQCCACRLLILVLCLRSCFAVDIVSENSSRRRTRTHTNPHLIAYAVVCTTTTQQHCYTTPLLHNNTTTQHHYYTTTLLHNTTTTQHHYYTTTLLHNTTTTQHYYTTPLLHNTTTTQQHYYTTPLLHNNTTTQHHYYTTTLLHNTTTTQHHYYTTTLLHNTTTTQQHYYTTPLLHNTTATQHHYYTTPLLHTPLLHNTTTQHHTFILP